MADLNDLLKLTKTLSGSDLHLSAGVEPRIRRDGLLHPVEGWPPLLDEDVRQLIRPIAPKKIWQRFEHTQDVDFACAVQGVARFRVNFFIQEHGTGAVFRRIPETVQPLAELDLPRAVESFAHLQQGLVLVTGPTGSGKSTTLAAIIDTINQTYTRHIVTIEDPVEFIHQNKKSIVSHREIGTDTNEFGEALRAALRQDNNVILLGEMRDAETISRALEAAEMGVLVFSTLHTNSAASTVERILDVFPAEQQELVRTILANTLLGVVSQILVSDIHKKGRHPAVEILVRTPAMGSVIRDGNTTMIDSIIQSGRSQGMQSMDDALLVLVDQGKIAADDAYRAARDKTRFERLRGGSGFAR